ncbi:MAG: DASS family sodium-coupled anion symporter [Woeseiaceae bacterium]|jgi:sodium-dependent dicarboxylate transporter 2/3/5|nr:DASS family sodium-coupled anion symporter [Woeseiaceae bacterium]
MSSTIPNYQAKHQTIGLYIGPIIAIFMLLAPAPDGLSNEAWSVAAMGSLMAIWWATEAIPIAITALLPLVFFPLLGISSIQEAATPFANKVIYLFLGGFIVAFAMQRWNLHRRIALTILQYVGGNGRSLVGGFMLVSASLSMWVMNTSTTMMLLPIAISVITVIHGTVEHLNEKQKQDFQYALLLGIAYAATIGGMSTLVGTAPNAMLAAFMLETYDADLSFSKWMLVGIPLSLVMAPLAWVALTRWTFKVDFATNDTGRLALKKMKDDLGSISTPEIRVGIIFLLLAVAWITRPILITLPGLSALDDSSIAMAGAISLFMIPSGDKTDPVLLRWIHLEKLPWSILLLFGGGLSLAAAVSNSGLAAWLGSNLSLISDLPTTLLVMIIAVMIIFLTELTSNVATTATFLPVIGAIAIEMGINPIILAAPVTLAASCAFMLPVATPPNAIVFGSGLLNIPKMIRAGLVLNLIGIIVVSLVSLTLAPYFLG